MLSGVDNITVDAGSGDLIVAEDGGNMELVVITPDGVVAPFLRVEGQEASEVTGPVFTPRRDRLYFSSQRGPALQTVREIVPGIDSDDLGAGVTYEITGPFRGRVEESAPTTTIEPAAEETTTTIPAPTSTLQAAQDAQAAPAEVSDSDDSDDGIGLVPLAVGGVVAVAAIGAIVAIRRRSATPHD